MKIYKKKECQGSYTIINHNNKTDKICKNGLWVCFCMYNFIFIILYFAIFADKKVLKQNHMCCYQISNYEADSLQMVLWMLNFCPLVKFWWIYVFVESL